MRILWLKTELLHPVDKGGKIRTYQMLKELKKKHHITYLTLDDGSADGQALEKSEEYAHETIAVPHKTSAKFSLKFYLELADNFRSHLPYALQKYLNAEMRRAIKNICNERDFEIVVCDFLAPAVNVPDDLETPTLLFQHNVEATIWRRHFQTATNPLKKAFLKQQWHRMRQYEKNACDRFDYVVAVSEDDAANMRSAYGAKNVSPIPTGVDTEYFAPGIKREKDPFNIVFTGSMDWLPNEDAMRWFTDEVLPRVRERIPDVLLTIVGRNPSPTLLDLSRRDRSVVVTGRVDDVRPYMERSSAYIVPIRIAGGTRLKIYEAMAMELPIVSSTIGAEGLPVKDGFDILLRDDRQDFADAVIEVLSDKTLAKNLGTDAARTVRERHSWSKVADSFADICDRAAKLGQPRANEMRVESLGL